MKLEKGNNRTVFRSLPEPTRQVFGM